MLVELVKLKNKIEKFSFSSLTRRLDHVENSLKSWQYLIDNFNLNLTTEQLDNDYQEIKKYVQNYQKNVDDLIDQIEQEIKNQCQEFLKRGYKINNELALTLTANADQDRQWRHHNLPTSIVNEIGSSIRKYTDWRYPCLEIGPGDGTFTGHLVGSDPLYLVDVHKEYLDKLLSKFNSVYRKRLRPYLIGPENNTSDLDLSQLPRNQISYIFSWGVFDYIPFEELKTYLTSCFKVMRPGGSITFSFNNCDTVNGAQLAVNGAKSWMSKKLITDAGNRIGFENIIFYENRKFSIDWVTMKKPGVLKSIKTAQPLYTIFTRPGLENIHKVPERNYNQQQVARLKQIAIKMGLDDAELIMGNKHTPHELEKMINIARTNL